MPDLFLDDDKNFEKANEGPPILPSTVVDRGSPFSNAASSSTFSGINIDLPPKFEPMDDFDTWEYQVSIYLPCVPEGQRTAAVFACVGKEAIQQLRALSVAPTASPEEVIQNMRKLYGITVPAELSANQFWALNQLSGEAVDVYVRKLRLLARKAFPLLDLHQREDFIRQRMSSGLADVGVRAKFLLKAPASLDAAIDIARKHEIVAKFLKDASPSNDCLAIRPTYTAGNTQTSGARAYRPSGFYQPRYQAPYRPSFQDYNAFRYAPPRPWTTPFRPGAVKDCPYCAYWGAAAKHCGHNAQPVADTVNMSTLPCDGQRKEGLMAELTMLFAPPTADSFGKKGLIGIPSVRRARKQTPSSQLTVEVAGSVARIASTNATSGQASRDDPYWRKPRANCHDFCDSCNCTEGDRLVCDRCPASFHLECLDPPLDTDEAPTGVWFCHKCTMLMKDEEDKSSTSSGRSVGTTSTTAYVDVNSSTANRQKRSRREVVPSSSSASASSSSTLSYNMKSLSLRRVLGQRGNNSSMGLRNSAMDLAGWLSTGRRSTWNDSAMPPDAEQPLLTVLWDVITYARFQNPKEFELPKDLIPGMKIPGSYKTLLERKSKPIIELENGQIPRPTRRCYICAKTCLLAALLPCDYCSACFHLECLDPPLPHFPPRSDRWMCPNHAEHSVDAHLVKSIRLSERIRLWDQLAIYSSLQPTADDPLATASISLDGATHDVQFGPEEAASVWTDLLRRMQRGRAEMAALQAAALATEADRLQFQHQGRTQSRQRPSLACHTPSARKATRNWSRLYADASHWKATEASTPGPRMRAVVPSAVKALYQRHIRRPPRLGEALITGNVPTGLSPSLEPKKEERNLFICGLLEFYMRQSTEERAIPPPTRALDKHGLENGSSYHTPLSMSTADCTPSETQITPQKLKDLLAELQSLTKEPHADEPAELPILAKRESTIVFMLAKQRLEELLRTHNESTLPIKLTAAANSTIVPSSPSLVDGLSSIWQSWRPSSTPIQTFPARAVLLPYGTSRGPPIPMTYRQLVMGTDPGSHLCLCNYELANKVACRLVSPRHATLFYDEWTGHFELLNYSEYGTRVDGITFGNDVSVKEVYKVQPTELISRVLNLLDRSPLSAKRKAATTSAVEEVHPKRICMAARREESVHVGGPCHCTNMDFIASSKNANTCKSNDSILHSDMGGMTRSQQNIACGWEGPAVVRHGSIIQLGCYQFVFSLVDPTLLTTNKTTAGRMTELLPSNNIDTMVHFTTPGLHATEMLLANVSTKSKYTNHAHEVATKQPFVEHSNSVANEPLECEPSGT